MVNYFHDLPTGPDPPSEIYVVVEMTRASKNKYEYDVDHNIFRLDRVLYTFAPFDYGFIPKTLDEDGDPLDVILLITEPTFTGCLVQARPIGIMEMDDAGKIDDKIIAVPKKDPYYRDVNGLVDLPKSRIEELRHFYATYKIQEGGHVEVRKFQEIGEAYKTIKRCIKDYNDALEKGRYPNATSKK
ncbi:MAG: inorganic diphosphatase [Candidatus Thorarchaeota archaeon]|jgi:inorganic pyrophosphatase